MFCLSPKVFHTTFELAQTVCFVIVDDNCFETMYDFFFIRSLFVLWPQLFEKSEKLKVLVGRTLTFSHLVEGLYKMRSHRVVLQIHGEFVVFLRHLKSILRSGRLFGTEIKRELISKDLRLKYEYIFSRVVNLSIRS